MNKKYLDGLGKLRACPEAVEWASTQLTPEKAWASCERGDWMLWLCGKFAGEPWSEKRKKLVLAACECARLALEHVPAGELRPLKAIETDERWVEGVATQKEVIAASYAAAHAADAAYASYVAAHAADAAYVASYAAAHAAHAAAAAAAADAAYASYVAAHAADAAADATYAASYAADDAADAASYAAAHAADAARKKTLKQCADIVRKYYPKPPRAA